MTASPKLLEPITLGDLQLKNRVVHAPMTRTKAEADYTPTDLMGEYYAQRSGAGLLIAEATAVSPDAIAWMHQPGAFKPKHVEGWKKVTDAVHAKGSKIFLQIWHPGRATHTALNNGTLAVAPSAIRLENDQIHTPDGKKDYETPRALETEEIPGIVAQFKQAASYAKEANFDGVEIHGANGYLIDQFLQSKTNHRADGYGGSVENRYRFLDEVVQAVLDVFPANRVGVRLAPNGVFNDMGSNDYQEQFLYVASRLNEYSLAYLHVMDGLAFGFHERGEPLTLAQFSEVYNGILIGNCGYTQDTAEQRIASGEADMIAFGRPFISTPDLVERFQHGWALNEELDPTKWYLPVTSEGYTDLPTAREAELA